MESFSIAKIEQLNRIYNIYTSCKKDLLDKNIYQWGEWNNIKWHYNNGKVLIIHALVIDPKQQNKGFGKKLLFYCQDFARKNKYQNIRLDSFAKNQAANMFYQKYGYKKRGVVIFDMKPEGNKEYFCYEKLI